MDFTRTSTNWLNVLLSCLKETDRYPKKKWLQVGQNNQSDKSLCDSWGQVCGYSYEYLLENPGSAYIHIPNFTSYHGGL